MTKHIALAIALISVLGLGALAEPQDVRITTTVDGPPLPPGLAGPMQPLGSGSGVIFGQVTEGETNRPVSGALVTLSIPGTQPIRVMADSQGRFGFRDLPRGRFNLSTTRPGWVDGAYGRTRPAGPTLALSLGDGEKVSGVNVPMWRYASIAGTVVDESGEPIVNKPVRTLKRTIASGKVRLVPGPQDTTDDRGMYRIGMLGPGEYIVVVPLDSGGIEIDAGPIREAVRDVVAVRATAVGAASAMTFIGSEDGGIGTPAGMTEDGRMLAFPTVFYPTAASASRASVIAVSSGEERAAVDFRLKASPTSKVTGTLMGPDGPAANTPITLVPAEADELVSPVETLSGFSDGQGRFTINGVVPGQYVLRAVRTPRMAMGPGETTTIQQGGGVMVFRATAANLSAPLPTDPTLWAEMTLSVGARDLTDLTVGLRPGVKVTGVVQFNGGAERPASDRMPTIGVSLEPADVRPGQGTARGRVEPSGQFSTMGVPPGRYFVRVAGAPQNWTFHSAMVNGRDASVVPVELESSDLSGVVIAFTDRPSELSGDVTVETGSPEAMSVLVFPAEQSAWIGYGSASRRFGSARVGKDGKYRLTNLPAGEYYAVAIQDRLAADWQNPKFLESLMTSASRVRVRDGDTVTLMLKVSR
jgi:hypothetical protein